MSAAPAAEVLVVSPLPEELAVLCRRLQDRRTWRLGRGRACRGRLGGAEVRAAVLGDGAGRAARALDLLLAAPTRPVRALLVVGVAGALAQDLAACEVIAAERIGTRSGSAPAPDAAWLRRLPADAARRGRLVSVERVVAGTDGKRALARELGPEALAVDLESAALAQVAQRHAVPFLVLRSISDTRDESLPRFLAACFRADGSVRRGRVLLALLRRPRRLRALRAVARRMRRCADALADAASAAVACAPGA